MLKHPSFLTKAGQIAPKQGVDFREQERAGTINIDNWHAQAASKAE